MLCELPSDVEIRKVVKTLGAAKALGPDGMTASFYQQFWPSVSPVLIGMIKSFFSTHLLKQLNHSFVALIPKTNNPVVVDHFRPISLCSVSCKVISKILTERLKVVLPKLISSNQSAFIPRRVIQDNYVTTMEIIHSMLRKSGKCGLIAAKLDMAQAYDCLEWKFLLIVLQSFEFS